MERICDASRNAACRAEPGRKDHRDGPFWIFDPQLRGLGHRRHFPHDASERRGAGRQDLDLGRSNADRLHRTSSSASGASSAPSSPPSRPAPSGLISAFLPPSSRDAVMSEQSKAIGLGISDQAVARSIMEDPNFRGADGQFSRALFDQALRQRFAERAGFPARTAGRHRPHPSGRGHRGRSDRPGRGSGRPSSLRQRAPRGRLLRADARDGRAISRLLPTSSCRPSTMSARHRSKRLNIVRSRCWP